MQQKFEHASVEVERHRQKADDESEHDPEREFEQREEQVVSEALHAELEFFAVHRCP